MHTHFHSICGRIDCVASVGRKIYQGVGLGINAVDGSCHFELMDCIALEAECILCTNQIPKVRILRSCSSTQFCQSTDVYRCRSNRRAIRGASKARSLSPRTLERSVIIVGIYRSFLAFGDNTITPCPTILESACRSNKMILNSSPCQGAVFIAAAAVIYNCSMWFVSAKTQYL
jgi:hypothetical protein